MDFFFRSFLGEWILVVLLVFFLPSRAIRDKIGWFLPLAGLGYFWLWQDDLLAWQRLVFGSLGLLYLLKGTILMQYPQAMVRNAFSRKGLLLYLTIWPGMDPSAFRIDGHLTEKEIKKRTSEDLGETFIRGYLFFWMGFALCLYLALMYPHLDTNSVSWLGIWGLLLVIHFGIADIMTALMQLAGWPVGPLFREPFKSKSLRDFWSRRWNLAFVEMDRILFYDPLRYYLGTWGTLFGVFAISGLLHEIGISYPVQAGWGLPLLYFILQSLLVWLETTVFQVGRKWPLLWARIWTWTALVSFLPLLFHDAFRLDLIVPLFENLHHLLQQTTLRDWFSLALWLAGIGHFCTILNWKSDLAKLGTFNRKIFSTYAGYVVLMIVSFGALTLGLHDQMLAGEASALCLAGLIALFWTIRLIIDGVYFKHSDWPEGPQFVIGHAVLNTLFILMAGTYWGLLIWHYLGSP